MTSSSRRCRHGRSMRALLPRRRRRNRKTARHVNAPNPSRVSARRTTAPAPAVGAIIGRPLRQHLLGDDELHDLARALVDLGDLRVALVALSREVLEVSVAAEALHAVACGL